MEAAVIAERVVGASGRVKPSVIAVSVILVAGFSMPRVLDHSTALIYLGIGMFLVGVGVAVTMQNLVLAVRNTVALRPVTLRGSVDLPASKGGISSAGRSTAGNSVAGRRDAEKTRIKVYQAEIFDVETENVKTMQTEPPTRATDAAGGVRVLVGR